MVSNAVFCMAVGLYFEARSESFRGQLLVANVINNRVTSKYYPKDVCAVIQQPKQFSFLNGLGKIHKTKIKNRKIFYKMIDTAKYFYEHKVHLTNACHYATIETNNKWTLEFDMVATTKGHAFYEGGCNDIKGRKKAVTQELAKR